MRLSQSIAIVRPRSLAAVASVAHRSSALCAARRGLATQSGGGGGGGSGSGSDTYDLTQAVRLVKAMANRPFDETVSMNIQLNVDPRKPNQMVRGLAQLPHGSGKKIVVAVFARGERVRPIPPPTPTPQSALPTPSL